jgi:hypothetical protein
MNVSFAAAPGPFTAPLIVRATLTTPAGPIIAEAPLEAVVQK